MSRIIAIGNHKGGVGKTTTSLNLAHALAADGTTKVLLCDVDPQAMLTKILGFDPPALPLTLYDLLVPHERMTVAQDVIHATSIPGVSLLPASTALANAEVQLVHKINRELTLRRALEPLTEFHFILLDCPPALSLLNTNALAAAHEVLIPVSSEFMTLEALQDFLATTEVVRRELNPGLVIRGILVTKHEGKTGHARTMLEALKVSFGEKVFTSVIPYSVGAKDSVAASQSMLTYDPESVVAHAYRSLAAELTHHA